ncbi:MAG: hypothetical protein WBO24_02190 [Nitrospirales bacterium]
MKAFPIFAYSLTYLPDGCSSKTGFWQIGVKQKIGFLFKVAEVIQWQVSRNQALTAIQFNIARICPIGQRMNVAG